MKRVEPAKLITAAVLAAILIFSLARRGSSGGPSLGSLRAALAPKEGQPEDAVYAMLDAARAGDYTAYLDCYTGRLRDELNQAVRQTTPDQFTAYLRNSNASVQGVALSRREPPAGDTARLRLEYIYRDRNDVQLVTLSKAGRAWKISAIQGSERLKTLVPFGTPVAD